jgi:hypothetical protein
VDKFSYICPVIHNFKKGFSMKKRLVIMPAIAIMALGIFVACSPKSISGEATAYGVVHAHYVGKVDVEVGKGLIKSVVFDEMELPYSWAAVTRINEGPDEAPSYVYKIQGVEIAEADFANQVNAFFARKIKIGNEILTLKGNTPTRGVYSNANIDGNYGIETWARFENTASWSLEQMAFGNYEVLKEDGSAYVIDWTRTTPVANTKGDRWQKSKNAYNPAWAGLDADKTPGRGWSDNTSAMAAYLVGKNPGNIGIQKMGTTKTGSGKDTWEFDTTTGATLVDISEYFEVVARAFNKI